MGPPSVASRASPEPPRHPHAALPPPRLDQRPDPVPSWCRALARPTFHGFPGSPLIYVGPCVTPPPHGGCVHRPSKALRPASAQPVPASRLGGRPPPRSAVPGGTSGLARAAAARSRLLSPPCSLDPDPKGSARLPVSRPRVVPDVSPFQELTEPPSPGPTQRGFGRQPSSMGFVALRRMRRRAATCTGVASPGYAASSGFLGPSTLCSAHLLSGLVSCR
jgi:hypothetical protein